MPYAIALTGNVFPLGEGCHYGGERIIYYLIQELAKRGHEIYLFSCRGTNVPSEYIKDFVEVPVICAEEDVHFNAIREYQKRTGIEFDIYHCNAFGEGFDPRALSEYNYCELVWCNWSHVKQNIVSYSRLLQKDMAESGRPSTMIHYGIPSEYPFSPVADDYVVWFGKIEGGKGADIAIDIAQEAKMKIVLMGPPYDPNYFQTKILPRIDNDRVFWLRGVDDRMKSKVLERAKAFISTNVTGWTEYFGIVNIEALAHGVPIIAFSAVNYPSAIAYDHIIDEGIHGHFVWYDNTERQRDELVQFSAECLNKIEKIDRYECRKRFEEEWTSAKMTDRWEWLYQQIQDGKKFERLEVPF